MLEGLRQRLAAQSDRHQGIAAKSGKSLLDSELGEINDVIGRKCLGSEDLCFVEVLHSFWQRSKTHTHTAISRKQHRLREGCTDLACACEALCPQVHQVPWDLPYSKDTYSPPIFCESFCPAAQQQQSSFHCLHYSTTHTYNKHYMLHWRVWFSAERCTLFS